MDLSMKVLEKAKRATPGLGLQQRVDPAGWR
jgi:hypothetical protein